MVTRVLLKKLQKEAYDGQNSTLPKEISEMEIDLSISVEERLLQYLKEIQNPYRVRHDNVQIRIKYAPDGPSINKILAEYFERKCGKDVQ